MQIHSFPYSRPILCCIRINNSWKTYPAKTLCGGLPRLRGESSETSTPAIFFEYQNFTDLVSPFE